MRVDRWTNQLPGNPPITALLRSVNYDGMSFPKRIINYTTRHRRLSVFPQKPIGSVGRFVPYNSGNHSDFTNVKSGMRHL